MLLFKRTKAGALQYVLVIGVIVAIIIFAFISLLYLQKKVQLKNGFYQETIQNTMFGFSSLQENKLANNSEQSFQFSNNPLEKTTILKKQWGVYSFAIITSKIKNEIFNKIGLLGGNNKKRETLYLQENNKPLALVGNTKIVGKAYLPKQGIKRGNISGTSYNGNQLIYGNTLLSKESLPEIKNLTAIKEFSKGNFLNDSIRYFELEDDLKKNNSFYKATYVHQTNGALNLRGVELIGNIIIKATTSIDIYSSAILKDVILIAPEITIHSNVKGNFQAFASKSITVQENCTLNYPSTLVLFDENSKDSKENPQIITEGKTDIKGTVLYHSKNEKSNFNQQVIISENTTVTGEVYCNKNIEIFGKVYGSVYANQFITKKSGSVYVNHLYNAEINSTKLPEQFCGLSIEKENLKVAKWLH